jgi:hypothetical protein
MTAGRWRIPWLFLLFAGSLNMALYNQARADCKNYCAIYLCYSHAGSSTSCGSWDPWNAMTNPLTGNPSPFQKYARYKVNGVTYYSCTSCTPEWYPFTDTGRYRYVYS